MRTWRWCWSSGNVNNAGSQHECRERSIASAIEPRIHAHSHRGDDGGWHKGTSCTATPCSHPENSRVCLGRWRSDVSWTTFRTEYQSSTATPCSHPENSRVCLGRWRSDVSWTTFRTESQSSLSRKRARRARRVWTEPKKEGSTDTGDSTRTTWTAVTKSNAVPCEGRVLFRAYGDGFFFIPTRPSCTRQGQVPINSPAHPNNLTNKTPPNSTSDSTPRSSLVTP
jgi:hypothetical protein